MKIEEVISKIRQGEIEKDRKLIIDSDKGDKKRSVYWDGEGLISIWGNGCNLTDIYTLEGIMCMDFKLYEAITLDNLELRGVDFSRLKVSLYLNEADTLEIVLRNENSLITIGYWVLNKMGYDFKFVGDRFLDEDIFRDDLYDLIEHGQQILQNNFKEKMNDGSL